jgi:hypothetical protein
MRPDNDTDYWKRKYGPDERDVAFEIERERAENPPDLERTELRHYSDGDSIAVFHGGPDDFDRDYEEEAFNAAFVPDEDDDVDEARLARYDESG